MVVKLILLAYLGVGLAGIAAIIIGAIGRKREARRLKDRQRALEISEEEAEEQALGEEE